MIADGFKDESRVLKIVLIFTLLSVLVSALGLFAMSSYYMQQEIRSVSVKKVFGADYSGVLKELVLSFMKMVGIAFVIGVPIAWFIMNRWLSGYGHRIDLYWWIFALAGLTVAFIAAISVLYQSIKTASKIFRTEEIETTALNGVSFEIKDGEFVAIMGPSGCGKSTLLNILGLLDNPTGGSYELLGTEVANLKEKERTKFRKGNIGFVFQSFNLIDELNVYENIELPLRYLNISASERKAKVTEIMKRMAISHRAQHFPQQLSGGQQQRVAIARAVVAGPKLILADEPTGNLDSKNGKEVMDLLKELNAEGTTIVMVTHSQKDAAQAQRTIDLFDGQIVSDVKNEL